MNGISDNHPLLGVILESVLLLLLRLIDRCFVFFLANIIPEASLGKEYLFFFTELLQFIVYFDRVDELPFKVFDENA